MALLLAALLMLSAIGAATLIGKLAAASRSGDPLTIPLLPATALAVLLVLFMFAAGVRRFAFPLGDIIEAANRIADGDLSTRITELGPPSLRMVGHAFNTMAATLESQERQRRNLMADIAHELRTPLSVIQGRLEGMLDGVYPRDGDTLSSVIDETRLVARLVEDLRTLAVAESGALTLQKEPTDIATLLHDVVSSLPVDPRRVSIRVDAAADLPAVTVDPLRIRQVVANLVSNAVRHSADAAVVTIGARAEHRQIVVTVADTGAGIPPADLPKIFDRFYKGPASRGSGLGLTIARNLVIAHGGEISAESTVGQGTTIRFTLPVS